MRGHIKDLRISTLFYFQHVLSVVLLFVLWYIIVYSPLYNTGLYNKMQAIVPSCYTHEKTQLLFMVECRGSLTASGKKLLCSLVVQQQILLYHLPDGSWVNRLLLRWVLSFSILWTLHRQLTSLLIGRWVPMMFWEVLIPRCTILFLYYLNCLIFIAVLKSFNSGSTM